MACEPVELEGEEAKGQLSGRGHYGAFYTMVGMWTLPSVLEASGELTTIGLSLKTGGPV